MRDYACVMPTFWTGPTGKRIRKLGPAAQVVAMYLITSPHSNMIGLYYLPLLYLSHDTGLSTEAASSVLRQLSDERFSYYDHDHEVVWVPEMARMQLGRTITEKDKRHAGLLRELDKYRKCSFIKDFWEKYREAFHLPERCPYEDPEKDLGRTLEGPSKDPLPRAEQNRAEQEQEQEQEHTSRVRAREGPDPNRVNELYLEGWKQRFGKTKPPKRSTVFDQVWQEIANALSSEAELEQLLTAFWADGFCHRTGYKPGTLASERARLLTQGPKRKGHRARPASHDEFNDDPVIGEMQGADP